MSLLDKIKGKTRIDVNTFVNRLLRELYIDKMENEKKKKLATEQLVNSIYEVLIIILDKINQDRIPEGLYTTWLEMVRDYWHLNKYDKQYIFNTDSNGDENSNVRIKSVQIGDTTTTFVDTSSQIDINGTIYNTGTVDFDEDILVEKYKKRLYKHRKLGW